ncbi:MAG: hypothetical protein K6L81_14540 [Agarilytica sp.]
MSSHWQDQKERGGRVWISILVWVALNLGRTTVLLLLRPVTLFYIVFARDAVAASRSYLNRTLSQPPGFFDIWKHFLYFATVSIDRLYFLSGKTSRLSISYEGDEILRQYIDDKQGCIILVSHIGSFDALRVSAIAMKELPLKIVMDHKHNPAIMSLIDSINSDLASCIIDSNQSAPALALTLAENLQQGNVVGIMADRHLKGESQVACNLLGGPANFPVGPWLLASTLKVPVLACFGIYEGGNRYSVHVEVISEKLVINRRNRQQELSQYMQLYADRIEHYIKQTPYNWFNFYDFWQNEIEKTSENAIIEN